MSTNDRFLPRALLVALLLQFLCSFRPSHLAWDGVFYYAYARSVLFDGDLRLGNDLTLSFKITPAEDFAAAGFEHALTPTGRVANPFAIGTALLWLPWLAVIYGAARLGGAAPTGYEWPFVWTAAVATCVYGWLAVATAYRLARKVASERAALLAAATAMLATPLWYYGFREPFYAHAASALTVAVMANAWWQWASEAAPPAWKTLLLGGIGGLAALVRWQNVTYLSLPLLSLLAAAWPALRKREWRPAVISLRHAALIGLGAAWVMALQSAVWRVLYGRFLTIPQGAGFIDWRAPWLGETLLSTFNGLLPWMPLVVPALAGLLLLARRQPRLAFPLLFAFLFQVYVNACLDPASSGGGYGPRRFSNTLVILVLGTACLLDRWRGRWGRWAGVGLSGLLALHQLLLLRFGFPERIGGQVTVVFPDWAWAIQDLARFGGQMASYLPRAFAHPLRTLVMPSSPLALLSTDPLASVAVTALFAGVMAVTCLLLRWGRLLLRTPRLLLAGSAALIALACWWILARA